MDALDDTPFHFLRSVESRSLVFGDKSTVRTEWKGKGVWLYIPSIIGLVVRIDVVIGSSMQILHGKFISWFKECD